MVSLRAALRSRKALLDVDMPTWSKSIRGNLMAKGDAEAHFTPGSLLVGDSTYKIYAFTKMVHDVFSKAGAI